MNNDDEEPETVGWVHWNDGTWSRLGVDGFPDEPLTVDEVIARAYDIQRQK